MSLKVVWDTISKEELSRKDCCNVDLASVTQAIVNAERQYTLRAEGHLVYGISQIWDKKAFYLKQDSVETEKDIETSFSDFMTSAHITARAEQPSLDLIEPEIHSSQIPSSRGDGDYSVDALMRSGSEHNELSDSEIMNDVVRSETELQELEHMDELELDFGNDMPLNSEPEPLDFGSDIGYSSSPPHTPTNEPVAAEIEPKVASRKRNAKQAVIDDEISIRIPNSRSVPAKIKRKFVFPVTAVSNEQNEQNELNGLNEIPLGDLSKLLDAEYIETVMHRRSDGSIAEEPVENNEAGNYEDEDHLSELEVDFGLDEPSFSLNIDSNDGETGIGAGVEDNEDEEIRDDELKAIARQTRSKIRKAVSENDVVDFNDLAQTAQQRACTLMEVLILASKREIKPLQPRPFGGIELKAL